MKILLALAMAFVLWGCENLPSDPTSVQNPQAPDRFRAPGQPYQPAGAPLDNQTPREPVPGEIVRDR